MKTSQLGIDLIKHYEQLHDGDLTKIGLQPKMCPHGIWTVGYGRALRAAGGLYLKGEADKAAAYAQFPNLTIADAERMLAEDLYIRERLVDSFELDLLQYQFDALVSIVYNVGHVNLKSSSLLLRIKKQCDPELIEESFLMWNKARLGGKLTVLKGLVKRRQTEATLYNTGKLIF